jgi:hypothetical protein
VEVVRTTEHTGVGVGWRHGALVAWCGWVEARMGDEGRGGIVVRGARVSKGW